MSDMAYMLKYITFVLFFSLQALAKDCPQYELTGVVRVQKTELRLIVAEKTASEKNLPLKLQIEPRFAPYKNQTVSGVFTLEKPLMSGVKILAVESIDSGVADPLNQNQETTMKKLKDVTCPGP